MEPSSLFPAYIAQQAVQAPSSPLEPFADISVEPSFLHGDILVKSRAMVVLAKYLVKMNRFFESPIALLEEALKC